MALLFASHGIYVLLNDPSEETINSLLSKAKEDGLESQLSKHLDYADLCKNLDSPKVFIFSLPHGTVGDGVVDGLKPYLEKGKGNFRCPGKRLVKACVRTRIFSKMTCRKKVTSSWTPLMSTGRTRKEGKVSWSRREFTMWEWE